jgi:molybdopterin-synthase adenylyltransferase
MHSVLFLAAHWRALRAHLEDAGDKEAAAFLLIRSSRTASGARVLVERVLLPPAGSLEHQGPDSLRPSGQWLSSVIGTAVEARTGLAFIHSHPHPAHPPALSALDYDTSITWSQSLCPMLDGPFASLVWSPRGVAGVVFERAAPGTPIRFNRVASLGEGRIEVLEPLDARSERDHELDDRQVRALTALGNWRLRNLEVGLVGAGGTGSPLAEQLVRMGVASLVLVDPDVLTSSNLRRVVGSRPSGLGRHKVEVLAQHLDSLGLATRVTALAADVRHEKTVRRLLDCDIVISSTDTQSSRVLLNQMAYQAWLPMIDVGVRIGTAESGAISGMPVEVRTLLPDNGCLWCRKGVLDAQAVYEENLTDDVREGLQREGYVQGLQGHQPSVAPLNYFAAGLAALTLLHLYSNPGLPHASVVIDGWEHYVHPLSSQIDPQCICHTWRGKADTFSFGVLPEGE